MSENKARRIKLYCPSVPKMVSMVAWEDQRLDLGSIARTFGLDPPTIKFNGHFISRGPDLIASSVTWKSLLCFFSAKGLSTGENDTKPLVVDGKLCRVGSKRGHGSDQDEVVDSRGRPALENDNLKRQKMRTCNVVCSKRKQLWEDVNLLKKLKISETNPDFSSSRLRCSFMSGSTKRLREDEAVLAAPCKKI